MSQITWKNVDAPSNATAALMQKNAGDMITGAFDRGAEALEGMHQRNVDRNTGDAMSQLAQMNDINSFDQDKAALLSGLDMRNIDQEKFMGALMERRDTLDLRDEYAFERQHRDELMAMEKSALGARISASNRSGRGGGGGSGGGAGGDYSGRNGATREDMFVHALAEETQDMNPLERETYIMRKGRDMEMNSKQLRYSLGNNYKGDVARFSKKKSDKYIAKTSTTDKLVNSGESAWHSPVTSFTFDAGANRKTEQRVLDMRAAGGNENDILKLVTDTRGKNRVTSRSKFNRGADRIIRAAKAARGEE